MKVNVDREDLHYRRESGREKDEDEEKQNHFPAFFLWGVYEGSFATVSQLLFFDSN